MELFRRAAEAGGQLLRVDRLAAPGDADATRASAFLLTFDVGRILVSPDLRNGGLELTQIREVDDIPAELTDSNEEDPWWRLLGCALARVHSCADAHGLRLLFRIADDRLRALTLRLDGSRVRADLENAA